MSAARAMDGGAVRILAAAEQDVEQLRPGALQTSTALSPTKEIENTSSAPG